MELPVELERLLRINPEILDLGTVLQATVAGNTEKLKKILDRATHSASEIVNSGDLTGCTALHLAARFGRAECAELLLQCGADSNVYASPLGTPLSIACRFDFESVVILLLEYGADPLLGVPKDGTILHIIARYSTVKIADSVFSDNVKPPVKSVDDLGMTPLHNAAQTGNEQMCTWLLDHGAELSARDARKGTPFMMACRQGHVNVMRVLYLSYGLDVNERTKLLRDVDDEGMDALHHAVMENKYEAAQVLLEWGADPNTVNVHRLAPLHICAVNGRAQMVPLLLDHHADPSLRDRRGATPLHVAVEQRHLEVIAALIKQGADINPRDLCYQTPLHIACLKGYEDVVQLLAEMGADLTLTNFYSQTCFHLAAEQGHLDLTKLLWELCGKNTDLLTRVDMFNQSVLHVAARQRDIQFVDALLQWGCPVEAKDARGALPLHVAARGSSAEIVLRLADLTTDVNEECCYGKSAFFVACETGNREAIAALISRGANIQDMDVYFKNTLMVAAMGGYTDIVVDLIKMGVQVNSTDKERNSPLHYACDNGRLSTVKALLSHGAFVSQTNVYGKSPLDMAVEKSHSDVAVCMMEHNSWEESLSVRDDNGRTCIDKMIAKTPAAVKVVLDKCIQKSGHDETDEGYAIEFNYKYIDPGPDDPCSKRFKDNAIVVMLNYDREDLLLHPLCQSNLSYKWHSYGKTVFFFTILMQFGVLITMMLFYFTMPKPHDSHYMCNQQPPSVNNGTNGTEDTEWSSRPRFREGYMWTLEFCLYGFIGTLFCRELLRFISAGCHFMITSQLVLTFISMGMMLYATLPPGYEPCDTQWRAISYSIVLFCFMLSLVIRRFYVIGEYFTMFFEVAKTMVKVSILLIFFTLVISIPFTVMLDQDGFRSNEPTVLTTFAMIIGELNYRDNFVRGENSPFTIDLYSLFPIFCLTMNVAVMNLMIGIAVGDINRVEKRAFLSRLRTQIHFLLETERSIVPAMRRKFHTHKLIVRPNSKSKSFFHKVKRAVFYAEQVSFLTKKDTPANTTDTENELREELEKQNAKLNKLCKTTEDMLQMLAKLTGTDINESNSSETGTRAGLMYSELLGSPVLVQEAEQKI